MGDVETALVPENIATDEHRCEDDQHRLKGKEVLCGKNGRTKTLRKDRHCWRSDVTRGEL
jgi:hypothetical protein